MDRGGGWDDVTKTVVANYTLFSSYTLSLVFVCVCYNLYTKVMKFRFLKLFKIKIIRLTASRVARDKPWSTLCKKSHGIPSSPRAAAVAKFRLLTGHDCLCAHLFRFNLVTSPVCVLCDTGQDMTAAHLDECSALNDLNCIVKRYWRARCLMT
ncbi:uncharacterized protein TNCV_3773341 [Trichonephila clavipes]|nr:uncharacterized protein TNCV_3773341 [Trichonephila clavipes]